MFFQCFSGLLTTYLRGSRGEQHKGMMDRLLTDISVELCAISPGVGGGREHGDECEQHLFQGKDNHQY
jgi:hypothetical protein